MKRRKPKTTQAARMLRNRSTGAEKRLWRALRARQLDYRFRRQVPICGFVVAFACFEAKVVVELDGSQHASAAGRAADALRDAQVEDAGFRMLRYWNHQLDGDLPTVLDQIYSACASRVEAAEGGETASGTED